MAISLTAMSGAIELLEENITNGDRVNLVKQLLERKHLIWLNLIRPRRALNSLLAVISFEFKLLKPWGRPVVVDMEPTNFCNLKCQHCQVTYWQKPKNRLTMDHFHSWVKPFKTASRIKLQGMGEPFLNEELPGIIRELERKKMYIEVVSNGTIMTDEICEVITKTRHLSITISFDGADKETFESLRIGGNFDKIKANLIKIIKTKPRRSKVSAWMVGFEEYKEQIKPTIGLLADLGVDEFHLQMVVINFGQDSLDERTVEHRIKTKGNENALKNALYEIAKQKGIKMVISDDLFDEQNPCPWPWLGTYIDTEGYVIPCCRVANAEICNFGNLNRQDFRTIWYSKEYQRLREQIKKNKTPKFCRSCYRSSLPKA
jgi:radical SAM protein with 4Fe4S-binding SPASM domain